MRDFSASLLSLTQKQTQTKFQSLFDPITKQVAISYDWITKGQVQRYNTDTLLKLFLPGIRQLPQCCSLMVSDMTGYEFLIIRNEDIPGQKVVGRWSTRDFRHDEWGKSAKWTMWDAEGKKTIKKWQKDEVWKKEIVKAGKTVIEEQAYDPRPRIWHKGPRDNYQPWTSTEVALNPTKAIYWTDVYMFFTSKTLGITASIAAKDPKGEMVVIGYDLLLKDLGIFTQNLKPTPNGKVFVFDNKGQIISLPNYKRFQDPKIREKTLLKPVENIEELSVVFKEWRNRKTDEQTPTRFEINGEIWWASFSPYQVNAKQRLWSTVMIPESDLIARVKSDYLLILAVSLAALLLAMLFAIVMSRYFAHILNELVGQSSQIAALDFTGKYKTISSPLNEVRELSNSLEKTKNALKTYVDENKKAQNELKKHHEQLEELVANRTKEIEVKNLALKDTLKEVEKAKEIADVANQTKSTFLANMSHELRTPLNAILGFAQIMSHSPHLSETERENIDIIQNSGEHLLNLINQILDLSKIEAGQITLNEKNFNLHRLLNDLKDMFSFKTQEKGLYLELEYANEIPEYICADEIKLRQILINLLNNAIKFTKQGGIVVRIKLESKEPTKIIFEVEDSGIGISPQEIDALFEAFIQTTAGKQSQEGSGLGLSISKKFVELMRGNICVSSNDKGTTFQFSILAKIVQASAIQSEIVVDKHVIALKSEQLYRLLIVDDNAINRKLFVKLLAPLGFELREAKNGQEAVELWESWEPHLVWMDIKMPIMNGYKATQHIKNTEKGKNTIVIAVTASSLGEEKKVALKMGCDDFVRKPFREEIIFEMMAKHLGLRYVYNEHQSKAEIQNTKLKAENLSAMPQKWLDEIYQASIDLDDDKILALIKQIPQEHIMLANALNELVNRFQIDQITALLEQIQ